MDPNLARAPVSGNLSESLPSDPFLKDGFVYKTVSLNSVVVRRKLTLFREKFYTYHNFEADPAARKTWDLNRKCKLEPRNFVDIKAVDKVVRPPGVWTLQTAFGDGVSEKVKLWMFTVTWPNSWAPQGYTSFTLGAQTKDDAFIWFQKFEEAIEYLKDASKARAYTVSGRSSSRDSEADVNFQMPHIPSSIHTQSVPIHKGSVPDLLSSQNLSLPVVSMRAKAKSLGDEHLNSSNHGSSSDLTAADTPLDAPPAEAAAPVDIPKISPRKAAPPTVKFALAASSKFAEGNTEMDSPTFHTPTARAATAVTPTMGSGERWVPYKHVNGVAIYYNTRRASLGPGPEYMASCIVRGSPKACVETLMNVDSNTTILGPVSELQVVHDAGEKQVMRIRITAPGFVGKLCAPREMVVERLTKKEEEGIYAILFHSCASGEHERQELAGGFTGWWKHPVTAKVTGGYTIAPLEGRGDDSEECLVTCVLHVDLGGQCSEGSWFWPVAEALGFKDAFVERILMSVILIKDEIEHKRFVVQPFSIMLGDQSASETAAMEMKRSSTMIVHKSDRRVHPIRRGSGPKQEGLKQEVLARLSMPATAAPHSPAGSSATTAPLNKAELNEDEFFEDVPDDDLRAEFTNGADSVEEEDEGYFRSTESLSTLDEKYWCEIHRPNTCFPFKLRGPNYLKDKVKIQAGEPAYELASVDLVIVDQPTNHIARFLPSIRKSTAAFSFICQLIIPGTPLLGLVVTFITDVHPETLGAPPSSANASSWRPFDYVMHRFLNASDDERNGIFKLIPHIAEGSWVIRQSVGTTPVILGRKLKTKYTLTPRYIEVDVDISANSTAAYVVNMVKGATKSLVIDLSFVLEGQFKQELPEALLGAARWIKLDLSEAVKLDTTKEIDQAPVRRTTSSIVGLSS